MAKGGFPGDLGQIMKQAQQMMKQQEKLQEDLRERVVDADAGGGMVTAFVNRWIRGAKESLAITLGRGVAAALLTGIAFWAISGIWLDGSTRNPDYLRNFVSWFIAFFPGFACLLLGPEAPGKARAS